MSLRIYTLYRFEIELDHRAINPVCAADLVQLNLILNCPLQSKTLKFVHQMKLDELSYILWGTTRAESDRKSILVIFYIS